MLSTTSSVSSAHIFFVFSCLKDKNPFELPGATFRVVFMWGLISDTVGLLKRNEKNRDYMRFQDIWRLVF